MKTDTAVSPVAFNADETAEMEVADVAKIFDMLSTGLYSNVPQSVVREIWSNARDAHADAGCLERPFEVTFPSLFNPVFRVRDFGVSLSHSQVMGLYKNLGESTKEDSNTGVGKFGIGSKSPFAYTDSFTVSTFLDGVQTFYSVAKRPVYKARDPENNDQYTRCDEDGNTKDGRVLTGVVPAGMIPFVAKMAEQPTDAENGVEVTFPIERNDIDKFREAAHRVAFGFEVKPISTNPDGTPDDNFEGWKTLPVISEGPGWKLLKGELEGYRGRAYANMGGVLYPIDGSAVDGLDYAQKRMLDHTIIIEFPIGDLDITPSRESLKYDRHGPTSTNIKLRLEGIVDEMVKATLAVYDKCATRWEAVQCYRQQMSATMPDAVRDAVRNHASWNGYDLSDGLKWRSPKGKDFCGVQVGVVAGSKLSNVTYRFQSDDKVDINPNEGTVIAVEDLTETPSVKKAAARLRKMVAERNAAKAPVSQIVWVKFHGGKRGAESMMEIMEMCDGGEIISVSDLEMPAAATYSRRPVQVRQMDYGSFDTRVDLSAEQMEDGGFYIPLERMEPQRPYGYASPRDMVAVLQELGEIPHGTTIYGAPKSMWKKFEGKEWVNVYELADKTYKKVYKTKTIARVYAIDQVRRNTLLRFCQEHVETAGLQEDSTMKAALEFFHGAQKMKRPDVEAMIKLGRAVAKDTAAEPDNALITQCAEMETDITATYPMLPGLSGHYRSERDVLKHLTHYVDMCDTVGTEQNQAATAA